MKKIFTLIAVAAMALSASAQEITFSETAATGTLNGKTFSNGNFSIVVTDLEGKFAIDNPTAAFFGTAEAYKSYAFRLKTGAT
jgi:polyisoprenoid-binding protein YceI